MESEGNANLESTTRHVKYRRHECYAASHVHSQTKRASDYDGIFPVHRHLFCTYGCTDYGQWATRTWGGTMCCQAANVVSHALTDHWISMEQDRKCVFVLHVSPYKTATSLIQAYMFLHHKLYCDREEFLHVYQRKWDKISHRILFRRVLQCSSLPRSRQVCNFFRGCIATRVIQTCTRLEWIMSAE